MRPERGDVPLLDALVEMDVRAVVDGDIEMRANRFFGKDDARFVSRTTRRFAGRGVSAGNRDRICAASSIS